MKRVLAEFVTCAGGAPYRIVHEPSNGRWLEYTLRGDNYIYMPNVTFMAAATGDGLLERMTDQVINRREIDQ